MSGWGSTGQPAGGQGPAYGQAPGAFGQQPPPLPGAAAAPGYGPAQVPPPLPGTAPAPAPAPGAHQAAGGGGPMVAPAPMPAPPPMPAPGPLTDPAILHVTELTRTYPCRSCGAELVFDPTSKQLLCPACGTRQPIIVQARAEVPKHDLGTVMDQLAAAQRNRPAALSKEIVCQACGGHTTFVGSMTALRCPYCNTPIQRDDLQDAPARLPVDGLLPLVIDQATARARIESWINSRWFAPNQFKKYRTLGSFTSIYLAYYAYDADTVTRYSGSRGEHYYVTVKRGDQEVQEQRTRWYPASGVVRNRFDDVTGLANGGLDTGKVQELEPWPVQSAVPYQQEFVAGHLARTYDHTPDHVFEHLVRGRMEDDIDATIRYDIGGDVQQIHSRDVTWNMLQFAHLLFPAWLLTVTFNNRPYQVFINGVTGEVQGQRPYSAVKITLAVLAVLVVVVALYLYFG